MKRSRSVRSICVGAVLVVGLVGSATSAFGVAPTAKATPNTGLANNQTVKVTGAHWPKSDTDIAITECTAAVVTGLNQADCNLNNIVIVKSSATGAISGKIKVTTGTIGTAGGTCGTTETDETCYLGVADVSDFSTVHALAKIVFS